MALLGLLTLVGYVLQNQSLIELRVGLQGMSPLTALGILAVAASFIAETWNRVGLARALASAALAIGLVTLFLNVAKGQDSLSPLVARNVFGFDPLRAGRTALATAACLASLGLVGLVRRRAMMSDALALFALIVSGLALLGYAYGVEDLYRLRAYDSMALNTAASLFGLTLVSFFLRPTEGLSAVIMARAAGGGATRRQLSFILMLPIVGWLLVRAIDVHRLGPAAAMAVLVVLTVVPLGALVLRDGRALNALEAERRAKAELQEALEQKLRARLAEQAFELDTQNAERAKAEAALQRTQRMDAVGQLTGGIAHDFNNLLMAIHGNLELLARKLPEGHPARRYVVNATSATDKGTKLTGQLLAFSRTQKLELRPVEVDPVLTATRDLVGNAMGPGIQIDMALNAGATWALADPDQLEFAILNLALNARDAMPEGGRLTIESSAYRGRLTDEGDEVNFVAVRVIDAGVGMPPDVVAQAVEPFFTTKERGKGTGLGLAQVYGFVRQCGGDLRIVSAVGTGTTIEVLLPCTPAPAIVPVVEGSKESLPRGIAGNRPILVIDDDEGVRAVLSDALRAEGYDVHEAKDGPSGLNLLEKLSPAVAIIDFLMPGLNGAEVARRAQVLRPGLPVIFVSGYSDTLALDGIAGAIVLRKPFDVGNLQQAVSSLLH